MALASILGACLALHVACRRFRGTKHSKLTYVLTSDEAAECHQFETNVIGVGLACDCGGLSYFISP